MAEWDSWTGSKVTLDTSPDKGEYRVTKILFPLNDKPRFVLEGLEGQYGTIDVPWDAVTPVWD